MLYSKSPIFRLLLCKNITAIFIFGFLVIIAMLQMVYYSNSQVRMSPSAWQHHFQVQFFLDYSADAEKQYNVMYNLMVHGSPEPVKECTLGDIQFL